MSIPGTEMGAADSDPARDFKRDLLSLDVVDVIRKHITTGDPIALSRNDYFELRRRVAERFNIHPSAVLLVGSSRLGFSLKEKGKPAKRFAPFGRGSDLDVAVVSRALFDSYWDAVFDLVRITRDWSLQNGKTFTRDLFNGWITPSDLPNLPRFDEARKWTEFFDALTTSRLWGTRRVQGRLYRDWARLEAYQLINVQTCRNELTRPQSSGDGQ